MASIIDFLDSRHFLGPFFEGPSWDRWRAVLRAAFALPMSAEDLALFKEVAGNREPPKKRVRELVCAVGRGGGKDSIAAALATFIAVTGDFSRLRPGERGTVLTLAVDRNQARIAFNYIAGFFERVPLLYATADRIGDDIQLKNGAEIVVGTNSMRALRGKTYAAAIYDECAFFRDESFSNPDAEVDAAVSPGLMRFPGSLKILISSVHRRAGLLHDRFAQFYGKDSDETLVVLGESLQFNPTLDQAEIERQLAADYERASAEYLSRWRDDLTSFLDRALVEAAIDQGVVVRPPQKTYQYRGFVDTSGGRGDSFTCAISHAEGNLAVIDFLFERRAPFDDPHAVVKECATHLQAYGIGLAVGDHYSAEWAASAFRNVGITYEPAEKNKSDLYLESLPIFTSGRARIVENQRLIHQLISLERRAGRTGKDSVNHPDYRNAHDDLANVVCGALTLVAGGTDPVTLMIRAAGLDPNQPPPSPAPPRIAPPVAPAIHHPVLQPLGTVEGTRVS
jgi:hypothetical protein